MAYSGSNYNFPAPQPSGAGLMQLIQGFQGGSGKPYEKYGDTYKNYLNQGIGQQQPFYNAGTQATGNYQNWLQGQQDPSAFINHLMSGYNESPGAKYQQQQGIRAANNIGSASGLSGSSALQQQAQQNAQQISSGDQNQWLQNVLGINTNYGQGQQNLMAGGQHSADIMSNLFGNAGQNLGEASFGQRAGQQQDQSQIYSGILRMLMGGISGNGIFG